MALSGERLIAAPREKIWDALNDAEILRACIPGCTHLKKISATELAITVTALGPITEDFNGNLLLSDLDPPNGYTISSAGQGNSSITVRLTDAEHGTKLAYEIAATPTGKAATLDPAQFEAGIQHAATEALSKLAAILSPPAPALAAAGVAESPYHKLAEDHDHDPSNPHYFGLPIGVIIAATVATVSVTLVIIKFIGHWLAAA